MKKLVVLFVVLLGMLVLLCSCDCEHENLSKVAYTNYSICLDCGEKVPDVPDQIEDESEGDTGGISDDSAYVEDELKGDTGDISTEPPKVHDYHTYKGTTCVECKHKRMVYNFSWLESYGQMYNGHRVITIAVGEEYQLKYSADITESLFYDLSNFVFYEPYVVEAPSVISIDENGKIKGLKAGMVGIKNTGSVIASSNDPDERRIYIQVVGEYTETEYNDVITMANEIRPGQTIKFHLSNASDIDIFEFTTPSIYNYVKVICTYHGDYDGAPTGNSRLVYVQVLNANGKLMNSGTNTHDSAGDVFERRAYMDTSTGYIIFKFDAEYYGLFPSGYFTIEIVPY